MSEDNTKNLDAESTDQLSFEEFVKKQFELVFARLDKLEIDLRAETNERFLQLSRQIRDLNQTTQDWYSTARVSKRLIAGPAACLRARQRYRCPNVVWFDLVSSDNTNNQITKQGGNNGCKV